MTKCGLEDWRGQAQEHLLRQPHATGPSICRQGARLCWCQKVGFLPPGSGDSQAGRCCRSSTDKQGEPALTTHLPHLPFSTQAHMPHLSGLWAAVVEAGLKFTMETSGEQFAMTAGITMMPLSSAECWVTATEKLLALTEVVSTWHPGHPPRRYWSGVLTPVLVSDTV